jgi:hypothetical protein
MGSSGWFLGSTRSRATAPPGPQAQASTARGCGTCATCAIRLFSVSDRRSSVKLTCDGDRMQRLRRVSFGAPKPAADQRRRRGVNPPLNLHNSPPFCHSAIDLFFRHHMVLCCPIPLQTRFSAVQGRHPRRGNRWRDERARCVPKPRCGRNTRLGRRHQALEPGVMGRAVTARFLRTPCMAMAL